MFYSRAKAKVNSLGQSAGRLKPFLPCHGKSRDWWHNGTTLYGKRPQLHGQQGRQRLVWNECQQSPLVLTYLPGQTFYGWNVFLGPERIIWHRFTSARNLSKLLQQEWNGKGMPHTTLTSFCRKADPVPTWMSNYLKWEAAVYLSTIVHHDSKYFHRSLHLLWGHQGIATLMFEIKNESPIYELLTSFKMGCQALTWTMNMSTDGVRNLVSGVECE